MRDAVGMEIPLSMDHLGHLGVKSIIRLGKAYEKFNLSWMEDVIPWTYTDLLKEISDQSPTPILTGEDIYLKEPFRVFARNMRSAKYTPTSQPQAESWRRTRSATWQKNMVYPWQCTLPVLRSVVWPTCIARPRP